MNELMPKAYAKARLPRIQSILMARNLPDSDRRQLNAVKDALLNNDINECSGLDVLDYYLQKLERLLK